MSCQRPMHFVAKNSEITLVVSSQNEGKKQLRLSLSTLMFFSIIVNYEI